MSEVVYDVAVIGAGLAGLNAAYFAKKSGANTLLLEAEGQVGGKVQTDRDEDGFLYDRGFQVYFTAYDETPGPAQNWMGKESLFRPYADGAEIVGLGKLNRWDPISSLVCRALGPKDLLLLLKLNHTARSWETYREIKPTRQFLEEFGFFGSVHPNLLLPIFGRNLFRPRPRNQHETVFKDVVLSL